MNDTPYNLRVLIVDDEAMARARLRRLLGRIADVTVVGEADSATSLLSLATEHSADLILLDVEMPGSTVFDELSQRAQGQTASIVFVTAFDRYAAQAFEHDAVHFLLKPVSRDRLEAALDRVRLRRQHVNPTTEEFLNAVRALERRQQALEASIGAGSAQYLSRVLVRKDGAELPIVLNSVEAVEASGNYVTLHTATGKHLLRTTLNRVEQSLDPNMFVRIHRSMIINLNSVQQVQPWFWGDSVVINTRGVRHRMSRRYRDAFYKRFQPGGISVDKQP